MRKLTYLCGMRNLQKTLINKNLKSKKEIERFLVGKTVKITGKQNANNYGNIGDTFVVQKVDNFNTEDSSAQLKDYCNKIFFNDLELCRRNRRKSVKILDIIQDTGLSSLEQHTLIQNIFKF